MVIGQIGFHSECHRISHSKPDQPSAAETWVIENYNDSMKFDTLPPCPNQFLKSLKTQLGCLLSMAGKSLLHRMKVFSRQKLGEMS